VQTAVNGGSELLIFVLRAVHSHNSRSQPLEAQAARGLLIIVLVIFSLAAFLRRSGGTD
jgi:hypothetical protein